MNKFEPLREVSGNYENNIWIENEQTKHKTYNIYATLICKHSTYINHNIGDLCSIWIIVGFKYLEFKMYFKPGNEQSFRILKNIMCFKKQVHE